MELSERKILLLKAIISDYIITAEPVGSQAIVNKYGLGLSSATIRNEMADLEALGFIKSPHTSSGRIPSDLGYRYFVDELMHSYRTSMEEIEKVKRLFETKVNQLDNIIMNSIEVLSYLTNYATVAVSPEINKSYIKTIELVLIDSVNLVVIALAYGGIVKSKNVRLDHPISKESIPDITAILNRKLAKKVAGDVKESDIEEIIDFLGDNAILFTPVLEFLWSVISENDNREVYTYGATNLLNYPEYTDIRSAREIMELMEKKNEVSKILSNSKNDEFITVTIGDEIGDNKIKNYSIVSANYKMGDGATGKIAIIGPKRMDYGKVITVLDGISYHLNEILSELYKSEGES